MKPIHELDKYELRRAIADQLGYTVISTTTPFPGRDWPVYGLRGPMGEHWCMERLDGPMEPEDAIWLWAPYPNWPENIGDAVELCQHILNRLNEIQYNLGWQLEIGSDYVQFVEREFFGGRENRIPDLGADDIEGNSAFSLATLALLALRKLDKDK